MIECIKNIVDVINVALLNCQTICKREIMIFHNRQTVCKGEIVNITREQFAFIVLVFICCDSVCRFFCNKVFAICCDRIIKIDGESTEGITLLEAVKKLRGEPGTEVNLTVFREKAGSILSVDIIRDIIKIESLKEAKILEDNII